jgi:hypothetical protein
VVFEFDAANSPRPPGSPSNSFKIIPPHEFTFSRAARLGKFFSCNTYKKHWGGVRGCLPLPIKRHTSPFFSYTYELQIWQLLSFDIHAN